MIRFNQPRYILPLIVLPFIYVFFYMYRYTMGADGQQLGLQETASMPNGIQAINPNLPEPFLDEDDLKGKFDAFRDAHKNSRDFSAMQEIDRREEETAIPYTNQMEVATVPIPVNKAPTPAYTRPVSQTGFYEPSKSAQQELSDYENQMRLFKAQMSYLDSLLQGEVEQGRSGKEETDKPIVERSEDRRPKLEGENNDGVIASNNPQIATKVNGLNSVHFNTINRKTTGHFIKAIIDEELKVSNDTRIRIRLLEDILIGKERIPKGQYLYGTVASFKPQRVEVHISSMLLDNQIVEVALDIYDLDGMKGLYIPESQFRELAKNMGSNMTSGQQLNIDNPPDNNMQLMYGLAKDAFNTTAQAASKAIRKNKARLKYNSIVYLVNTNDKDTSSNNQRTR